ncbi:MAG TPA: hypothetical protein VK954_04700, partial [Methyloradius sp.]|nr:hypothetical protein [Methyloradius sp.]
MSNLILDQSIVEDAWQLVTPPTVEGAVVRKQAGKVVLFKLTGEASYSDEQITATEIPQTGKVLVPLTVWIARKEALSARLASGEIGIWL